MEQTSTVAVSDDALRLMVAEHGVRGTARLLGMDQRQTDAFRQRVCRGKWLEDPAIAAVRARNGNASKAPAVVAALSPAQAIAQEISALGQKSRLSLARGIAKAGEAVEAMDGEQILERSSDVKNVAQTADLIHGWKEAAPQVKIRLDVLGGTAEPIQAEAMEVESDVTFMESGDSELDDY